jgi:flagellar biosynthesis anti-sigma factor FlgM
MKISVVTAKYQNMLENHIKYKGTDVSHLKENTQPFARSEVSVHLSGSSQHLGMAKQALEPAEEIRESVVQPISEAIKNGDYRLNPERIAEKMIGTIIDSFA